MIELPKAALIAVLWNTNDPGMTLRYREIEKAVLASREAAGTSKLESAKTELAAKFGDEKARIELAARAVATAWARSAASLAATSRMAVSQSISSKLPSLRRPRKPTSQRQPGRQSAICCGT